MKNRWIFLLGVLVILTCAFSLNPVKWFKHKKPKVVTVFPPLPIKDGPMANVVHVFEEGKVDNKMKKSVAVIPPTQMYARILERPFYDDFTKQWIIRIRAENVKSNHTYQLQHKFFDLKNPWNNDGVPLTASTDDSLLDWDRPLIFPTVPIPPKPWAPGFTSSAALYRIKDVTP